MLTALTMRMVFHLPLRQTEGFVSSLLRLMGLSRGRRVVLAEAEEGQRAQRLA
jgi:hypothetical protein